MPRVFFKKSAEGWLGHIYFSCELAQANGLGIFFNNEDKIEIIYTGLRPGEKLYEELMIDDSKSSRVNKNILKANESFINFKELILMIESIQNAISSEDINSIMLMLNTNIEDFDHN